MRDNVSIIFAAIFAVLLLIVFPLFSLLTRQDSISYNKVLTLTTEFVDNARTKGYFTDKDYTEYLTKLANTRNTYKVDMEYHKRVLIKDVNSSNEDVWVEDTEVEYNSYFENRLKNSQQVRFNVGDEFYVKVYNTNITTASLMYNFFLNSKIPQKIINIGYGGKVSNATGSEFTKTSFETSNTPYILFSEVMNKNGAEFKQCYDQEAGTYEMQYCIRLIDIENSNNNPIKVVFTMHNFSKIYGTDNSEISIDEETFEENKGKIISAIKEHTTLRGEYITVVSDNINIVDLKLNGDKIEGTIVIKDIGMNSGASRATGYIVITQNLGVGKTGSPSSEGITEELTFSRSDIASNVKIEGPYLTKDDNATEVTVALKKKETVYYKVILRDSDGIERLVFTENNAKIYEGRDVKEGKEISLANYNVKVEKGNFNTATNVQEYWIEIEPKMEVVINNYSDIVEFDLLPTIWADTYEGLNQSRVVSKSPKYHAIWEFGKYLNANQINWRHNFNTVPNTNTVKFIIYFSPENVNLEELHAYGIRNFFNEMLTSGNLYVERENGSKAKFTISTVDEDIEYYNSSWNVKWIKYDIVINYTYNPTGKVKKENMKICYKNENSIISDIEQQYANIPKGFSAVGDGELRDNSRVYYYWMDVNKSDISKLDYTYTFYYKVITGYGGFKNDKPIYETRSIAMPNYYDTDDTGITKAKIKDSLEKYGGYYIRQVTSVPKQSGYTTGETFGASWTATKNMYKNHDQLFSSMMYAWQYKMMSRSLRYDVFDVASFKPKRVDYGTGSSFLAQYTSKNALGIFWTMYPYNTGSEFWCGEINGKCDDSEYEILQNSDSRRYGRLAVVYIR